jgi:hypothetical protein
VVDTVTEGPGTGQTFSFDVTLQQDGAVLRGGNSGLTINGVVQGNTASVAYVQPGLGYTGTFHWTMQSRAEARGSFTNSAPNSGSSVLVRLQ